MSRASNLFRLQQIDTQLDRSRARIAEINRLLGEDTAVRLAKSIFDAANGLKQEKQRTLSRAEEVTREHRIKIEQTESHLYSGRVTNPKELQDLQNEVSALKRYLETLEERQLEAILAFEDAEAEEESAASSLEKIMAEKNTDNQTFLQEQTELQSREKQLETERSVALVSVKSEDRDVYNKLRTKRAGIAVAEAADGSCAACGSSLNSALYQSARMSDQLTFCDTCGRVLYAR